MLICIPSQESSYGKKKQKKQKQKHSSTLIVKIGNLRPRKNSPRYQYQCLI